VVLARVGLGMAGAATVDKLASQILAPVKEERPAVHPLPQANVQPSSVRAPFTQALTNQPEKASVGTQQPLLPPLPGLGVLLQLGGIASALSAVKASGEAVKTSAVPSEKASVPQAVLPSILAPASVAVAPPLANAFSSIVKRLGKAEEKEALIGKELASLKSKISELEGELEKLRASQAGLSKLAVSQAGVLRALEEAEAVREDCCGTPIERAPKVSLPRLPWMPKWAVPHIALPPLPFEALLVSAGFVASVFARILADIED
jgi:hypothetical protein